MPFTSFGFSPALLQAIHAQGYTAPTPIQKEAIPAVAAGNDLLGIAKTGSGKTASYVLPILNALQKAPLSKPREPSTLVLVPTRELADQVHRVFRDFHHALPQPIHSIATYGGVAINPQMQALVRVDVVVATPGRLLELVEKNAVKLSSISTLVLDEADKMLNLGFKDEVDRILALVPEKRQNLLFSATLSDDLAAIQQVLLHDPIVIKIPDEKVAADDQKLIRQIGYFVTEERKGPLLRYLIKTGDLKQVLVFASSTHRVDSLVVKLWKNKIQAAAIHSKKSQQARRQALDDFKSGEIRVLVTTDLLARGIDIEHLPCVINYELPRSPKDYVHRIGRTGRAESPGDAISLITMEELHHFRVIQKKMGERVPMLHSDPIDLHGY